MPGAIPPLPNTPLWRGAQFKKAQGQLYLHTTTVSASNGCLAFLGLFWASVLLVYLLKVKVKVKVKVKLSLCFNRAPRHEDVLGEWRYSSTHSLTSALDGREWSASRPGRFAPRERAPDTRWIGGWVGPRVILDAVIKRNSQPPPEIEP
jgi:hypothetical protein